MGTYLRRHPSAAAYLLLAPGLLYLAVFYVAPTIQMFLVSLWTGNLEDGYQLTFNFGIYEDVTRRYGDQIVRSLIYGGTATVLAFLIGFPLAYFIAFRGGRYKNLLLFLVVAPFFTSFLLRTISWKIIFADDGLALAPIKDLGLLPEEFRVLATPVAVIAGITYNFLPFMTLPLYVALEKIPRNVLEAAQDLYAARWQRFRRVTLPMAMTGVIAGSLLTFIPAVGDYINAELLGNPQAQMIGNVIQARFLRVSDYPTGAALSFILMATILVAVLLYARLVGTEQLVGGR
ncbi:MAG: spermidine/putrescine transport system permease protein [Chloroflexota bacterium]|nr:spermidine/putrescine transport system permease protein [Chloroflexota bacterium]